MEFAGKLLMREIGHILWEMFQWPVGIVVGNLIANIIWEWPSQGIHWLRTRRQNRKQTAHLEKRINEVNANV